MLIVKIISLLICIVYVSNLIIDIAGMMVIGTCSIIIDRYIYGTVVMCFSFPEMLWYITLSNIDDTNNDNDTCTIFYLICEVPTNSIRYDCVLVLQLLFVPSSTLCA